MTEDQYSEAFEQIKTARLHSLDGSAAAGAAAHRLFWLAGRNRALR
jgi:hypothetical protein